MLSQPTKQQVLPRLLPICPKLYLYRRYMGLKRQVVRLVVAESYEYTTCVSALIHMLSLNVRHLRPVHSRSSEILLLTARLCGVPRSALLP